MELRVGLKTNSELAEWFGVKPASFRNHKPKKLEELKKYADFELKGTRIYIKEIYGSKVYIKRQDYSIVKEEFTQVYNKSKIDTASNVSKKIYNKRKNDLTIKESTTYEYTREARNELYGKPFIGKGKLGTCRYIWVKKLDEGKYERFNDEEEAMYKKLLLKYFKNTDSKAMFVKDMIKRGEVTKEEAWDVYDEIANLEFGFMNFKAEMEEFVGCTIVRATEIEDQLNFSE